MTETLFKGMTRPAMVMGVPITPFAVVMGIIFLAAVYTNMLLLIAAVPAIIIMKIMTKKDSFIFRLLGLNILMNFFAAGRFTSPISKKYWQGLTFTAQKYKSLKEKNQVKLTAFDLNSQLSFLDLIPYSSHFSNDTVIDKDGNFIAVWKIEGVGFEANEEDEIVLLGENLNMIFKAFATEPVAFYHHNIRHQTSIKMASQFSNSFLKEIDELYYKGFDKDNLKVNSLYFTLVFQPFAGNRIKKSAFKNMSFINKQNELIIQYKQFKEYCSRLESNLSKFKPTRLIAYEIDDKKYSQILEFFSYLLSGKWQKVYINPTQIDEYMTAQLNEIIFGKDTIQLNSNDGSKKFARIIEIKDYTNETFAGILDILMYQNIDYIATHSFSLVPQYEAKAAISKQEKQLVASSDDGLRQLDELTWAKDELISGNISFGKYHFSILVFGSTLEQVQKNTNLIITALNDMGFGVSIANIALTASFFAQLPCNFYLRPRVSLISSKNFSSFVSFHNFPIGKKEQNCWGNAITALKSTNGTPYYLNFHETTGKSDFNEKHLGNTLIVGASGSGKTVLQLFLADQMMKYAAKDSFDERSDIKNFTLVFFDKDRGAHANVLACGGQYFAIKNGMPTGFNPFMCDNTPEKVSFLYSLMSLLVGRALTPVEEDELSRAIKSVLDMPLLLRKHGITKLIQHLSVDNSKDDTLYRRLRNWSKEGAYGWVFDNSEDSFIFDESTNIYGIDGTEFLDEAVVSAPICLYLFERINELIDGRRFILNIDECWKWIEDPTVAKVVRDKLKTIRKLNGLIEMATQSPEDFLRNPIARAVVEQSATLIFLPNPKAREEDYTQGFNLTYEQYDMIKKLSPTSRTFLLKKGTEATFLVLDLSALGGKNLKILSTTKDNWDLIDELQNKGLSSEDFVHAYKERCV